MKERAKLFIIILIFVAAFIKEERVTWVQSTWGFMKQIFPLLGAGMGKGPVLFLLLAGPALSLPNMLVIGGVMGVKKTAVFSLIIVVISTIAGMTYGSIGG